MSLACIQNIPQTVQNMHSLYTSVTMTSSTCVQTNANCQWHCQTAILIHAWVLCSSLFPDDGSCMLLKHCKDSSYLASVCETFDMSEIPIATQAFSRLQWNCRHGYQVQKHLGQGACVRAVHTHWAKTTHSYSTAAPGPANVPVWFMWRTTNRHTGRCSVPWSSTQVSHRRTHYVLCWVWKYRPHEDLVQLVLPINAYLGILR